MASMVFRVLGFVTLMGASQGDSLEKRACVCQLIGFSRWGRKAASRERECEEGSGDALGGIVEGGGDAGVDGGLVAGVAVCGCGVGECCD